MGDRRLSPRKRRTLKFTEEVRQSLLSEEGKRLKGEPAVFVGESTWVGPAKSRSFGPFVS